MAYTKGSYGVLAATFAALVIVGIGSGAPARMHALMIIGMIPSCPHEREGDWG